MTATIGSGRNGDEEAAAGDNDEDEDDDDKVPDGVDAAAAEAVNECSKASTAATAVN